MAFKLLELRRAEHRAPRGDRRRTVRYEIGWPSLYVVADGVDHFSYAFASDHALCVVRDLSIAGAGLELSGRELSVGDGLVLDLQLGEHRRASIRLAGEVRYARTDHEGVVRAGIEFVAVGDLERALLLRLLRERSAQARRTG